MRYTFCIAAVLFGCTDYKYERGDEYEYGGREYTVMCADLKDVCIESFHSYGREWDRLSDTLGLGRLLPEFRLDDHTQTLEVLLIKPVDTYNIRFVLVPRH